MLALSPQLRVFVAAMIETGGNMPESARLAGADCAERDTFRRTAQRWMANAKVQEAMLEEAKRVMGGLAVPAAAMLSRFLDESFTCTPANRLRAIEMVMNRIGMHPKTEHNVNVNDSRTDKQVVRSIIDLAKKLEIDPRRLLGAQGIVLDAEFEVIDKPPGAPQVDGRRGLEDLL